ncbi:MAG TPA: hypothetical protein ENH34_02815 [Phycisphaerales bacterium]|nr:hypothetical protein [Phycisphaerales bacterium]
MRTKIKQNQKDQGSVLALVVISLVILSTLGIGLLRVAYGVRRQAISLKNETVAMLAAEAGYEKAIFWMSQQQDMLSTLQNGADGTSGTINFQDGDCDYSVEFFTFAGSRPVYKVVSNGHSGVFNKTVSVLVLQAISGWDMGICRVPSGASSTYPVNFADGEIIDMPLHINKFDDSPDNKDIYIIGRPQFLRSVAMGESRKTAGGVDKYSSVMDLFDGGIYFDQPDSRITDEASVQSKIDRFKESTKNQFRFTPVANAPVTKPNPAVQLEFFVNNSGVGKVRITNNCTVRGYKRNRDYKTWGFRVKPGSGGTKYERYDIYAYHLMSDDAVANGERIVRRIEQTYVTQSIGGIESEPGGQIFVDGNVIIGGNKSRHNGDQIVKGKITVVATGNIWIADSVMVDGPHDANGKPSQNNPNVLGLIAQGVIKVVDPGMSDYGYVDNTPVEPKGFTYVPIGRHNSGQSVHKRYLPDPMVVEGAITVGGGGWGAENVKRGWYGGRKEASGPTDVLIVRGTISEAVRGVVGLIGRDGFTKQYYLDERLLEGVLPGDIWLKGKYIPAPAGWNDYRP